MNYKERIISERLVDGEIEYYRTLEDGREFITNKNGDLFLEITKEDFDAELPAEVVEVIEFYYPNLGKITSLRNVFPADSGAIVRDDEMVCFRTGIMDAVYRTINDEEVFQGYGRPKHPSIGEFEQFMSRAKEDKSNVWVLNPYAKDEEM